MSLTVITPCPPGYAYDPRVCPYHIIHFVTGGQGNLYINDGSLPAHEGEAFLIPADRIASYQASAQDPWSYAWVGFLGSGADRFVYQLTARAKNRYILQGLDTEKYGSLIRQAAQLDDVNMTNFYLGNSVLLQILAGLCTDIGYTDETQKEITLADEIRYYLEMKYSDKIKMGDVSYFLQKSLNAWPYRCIYSLVWLPEKYKKSCEARELFNSFASQPAHAIYSDNSIAEGLFTPIRRC